MEHASDLGKPSKNSNLESKCDAEGVAATFALGEGANRTEPAGRRLETRGWLAGPGVCMATVAIFRKGGRGEGGKGEREGEFLSRTVSFIVRTSHHNS